jgi:hypothetical protein
MEATIYTPPMPRQWDLPDKDAVVFWNATHFVVYAPSSQRWGLGPCVYVWPDGEAIASDGCFNKAHSEKWALDIVRHLPRD